MNAGRLLAAVLCLLTASPATGLAAQVVDTMPKGSPFVLKYGKWAMLGTSIGLGLLARERNLQAESAYDELNDRCFDVPGSCIPGPGGPYFDLTSERLYDRTVALDKQAGQYLIAAEVTFVVAIAAFVVDISYRQDRPPNIPFEPTVEYTPRATNVGMSFRF